MDETRVWPTGSRVHYSFLHLKGIEMKLSLEQRLYIALKEDAELTPAHRVRIYNKTLGADALTSSPMEWHAMREPLQQHIESLRNNMSRTHEAILVLKQDYRACLDTANALIRAQDPNQPIPAGKERWQEWVHKDDRTALINAFKLRYLELGKSGLRVIPFAPLPLRQKNAETLARCERAVKAEFAAWDTHGTGRHDVLLNALIMCACSMARIQMTQYKRGLASGDIHPYDAPAKVHWQHYCTTDMRARVRTALTNGFVEDVGLHGFYPLVRRPIALGVG